MANDIVERLRQSDGFKVFRASDGFNGIRSDTDLLREAADEIEQLRAENQSWRSLDQIRLDLLRQSAAEMKRLQGLIDAWTSAPLAEWWQDEPIPHELVAAEDALLAAATKEDDRG